jgi:nucleoside-diphosphate-sugar epimerase
MHANTEDDRNYRDVNVLGTARLAESAAAVGVRRFIFLSTVKVHGERTHGQAFSEQNPLRPQDAYARSKVEAEYELKRIGQVSGMEVVIIRPPLVYGAGVKANFMQLLKCVRRQIPFPLGAIHNVKSLIYLDNLVDALMTCIKHPLAANEAFLVSDGKDLSTTELVRLIGQAMGIRAKILSVPLPLLRFGGHLLRKDALVNRVVDSLQINSSNIRQRLLWTPPHSVEEGIKTTVRWYMEQDQ